MVRTDEVCLQILGLWRLLPMHGGLIVRIWGAGERLQCCESRCMAHPENEYLKRLPQVRLVGFFTASLQDLSPRVRITGG
jgi:hypothetical protein